ncbi:hypothetical protein H4S08_001870 [Coemansia sp. RSA 1365]|nr:hypothetical protein H4S08_001870 [Coemansia sp. RSA 1365]
MLGKYSWRRLAGQDDHRVSFTDSKLRSEIKRRFWDYVELAFISTTMIWAGLTLFFGGIYNRSEYANNIDIYVVDLDGGSVGANITQMILGIEAAPSSPAWLQRNDLRSLEDVKAWVLDNAWGALVINKGTSDRLSNALNNGTDYNPVNAMTLVESSGRQVVAEMLFVSSTLTNVAQTVSRKYALEQINKYRNSQTQLPPNIAALIDPISYTTVDVAPAGFTISPIMSTFGYLTILLSTVGVLIVWKMTSFPFFSKVRYRDLILMWPMLLLGLALILSFYQALAFLAFRGPNYNSIALTYTAATFFKFWFTGAAVAFSLALWLFNWFLHLTPHIIALPSICTVLPNVVSTIGTTELASKFYRIFYALPFFNGSKIILHITTGAHSATGRNVGVLVAEMVGMTLILWISIWIRQVCVLRGISDAHGWFHKSKYFHSPIPYYKSETAHAETHRPEDSEVGIPSKAPSVFTLAAQTSLARTRPSRDIEIADYDEDSVSLTTGNLGV